MRLEQRKLSMAIPDLRNYVDRCRNRVVLGKMNGYAGVVEC